MGRGRAWRARQRQRPQAPHWQAEPSHSSQSCIFTSSQHAAQVSSPGAVAVDVSELLVPLPLPSLPDAASSHT